VAWRIIDLAAENSIRMAVLLSNYLEESPILSHIITIEIKVNMSSEEKKEEKKEGKKKDEKKLIKCECP
jgi:hypothetical protein